MTGLFITLLLLPLIFFVLSQSTSSDRKQGVYGSLVFVSLGVFCMLLAYSLKKEHDNYLAEYKLAEGTVIAFDHKYCTTEKTEKHFCYSYVIHFFTENHENEKWTSPFVKEAYELGDRVKIYYNKKVHSDVHFRLRSSRKGAAGAFLLIGLIFIAVGLFALGTVLSSK